MSLPIFFEGGKQEIQRIIQCINEPQNKVLQNATMEFYTGKLTMFIEHFNREYLIAEKNGTLPIFIPEANPGIMFNKISTYIMEDFNNTQIIDFSALCLGYYILEHYISQINDSWAYTDKEDILNVLITHTKGGSVPSADAFRKVSKLWFSKVIPFFGKSSAYGIKTFLNTALNHELFPLGYGLMPYNIHGGMYHGIPVETVVHDLGHFGIVSLTLDLYGIQIFRDIYMAILNEPLDEQRYLLYMLFLIFHENNYSEKKYDADLIDAITLYSFTTDYEDMIRTQSIQNIHKFYMHNFKFNIDEYDPIDINVIYNQQMNILRGMLAYELYIIDKQRKPVDPQEICNYYEAAEKLIETYQEWNAKTDDERLKIYINYTKYIMRMKESLEKVKDTRILNFFIIMSNKYHNFIARNNLYMINDKYPVKRNPF